MCQVEYLGPRVLLYLPEMLACIILEAACCGVTPCLDSKMKVRQSVLWVNRGRTFPHALEPDRTGSECERARAFVVARSVGSKPDYDSKRSIMRSYMKPVICTVHTYNTSNPRHTCLVFVRTAKTSSDLTMLTHESGPSSWSA